MLNKLSFNLAKELNESETRRYKIKKKIIIESDCIKKEEIKEDTEEYLDTRYDPRKSFYKKARVVTKDNGDEELYSYDTHVGGIRGGKPYSKGKYSQTTTRHQKEFFKQRGHELKDVPVELDEKVKEKPITEATDINFKNLSNDQRLELKQRILSDKYNKENKEPSYSELADDEKKAIEDEIASIEKELEEGCNKSLKEDSYDDTFFSDIESALTSAGFDVTRFNDTGVLTKNLGWIVSNEEGEVQLSCDGTWLDESNLNEDDYEMARPWSTALIQHCENYGADIVWEEMLKSLVKFLPDDRIKEFCKSEFQVLSPEEIDSEDRIEEGCNKSLTEKYVETFGGDSEDFVSDVETIKSTLEGINTDSFGTKLAQQMVWDWIETCDYQIEKGNRLTKGEFNESALTEGFKLGEKAEILDTCERRGQPIALVKLQKNGDEYVVAFGYTVENDEVSWDYGYYYYNEESGKEAFEKVKAGGNLSESEEKLIVEAAETEVKDLQVIKEQGNVYMLEDKSEGTRYIVGENYNLSEGEIENAEIYENKEEADKDYLDRCEIIKDGEQLDAGNEETADINEGGIIDDLRANHHMKKAAKAASKGDTNKAMKSMTKAYNITDKSINKLIKKANKLSNKAKDLKNKADNSIAKITKTYDDNLNIKK